MLVPKCGAEYLQEVRAMADKIGKRESLEKALDYLDTYACRVDGPDGKTVLDRTRTRCLLFKDFAPLSFEFLIQRRQPDGSYADWFNGGCIFHGKIDGYGSGSAPTFSVCLAPTDGWEIHT
jgi:hypothetical protein